MGDGASAASLMGQAERRPLLERESELDEVTAILEAAGEGAGRCLWIEGPAGIGKSSLLDALADRATQRGFQVIRASGHELESSLAWGVVRELFERAIRTVPPEGRDSILSGAAALSGPILSPREGTGPPGEGEAALASALHGLYWLCANLAERTPLAAVVDDAHWADSASLRFLAYLVHRIEDLPVLLAVAVRSGEAEGESAALRAVAARATVIRPGPLSEDAVGDALGAMLGRAPAVEFARACHEATAGNPFLLMELARELQRDGVTPDPTNVARVSGLRPETVRRAILLRLARLPQPVQAIAESVAILGQDAPLGTAARLAGVATEEAASAADSLAAVQVLAPATPLRFVHPIAAGVVLEDISPARRALLHRRAADLMLEAGREEEAAGHLLLSDPAGDEQVVDVLRRQATHSLQRGAPEAAVAYLARAAREPPPAIEQALVLAQLADAEAAAGSLEAIGHMEHALELVSEPRNRAALSLRLGWLLCRMGRIAEGSEVLERALESVDDMGDDVRLELEAAYLANAWQVSSQAAAVRRRQAEFLERNRHATGPAQRALIAQSALGRLFIGDPVNEVVDLAERLFADPAVLTEDGPDSLTPWIAIGVLSWSDALDAAESAVERTLGEAQRRGSPVAMAWGFYARSWPRYWRGRVSDAAADSEAAIAGWRGAWEMYLPAAQYWLALSRLELDDLEGAEAALALPGADRWAGTTPHLLWRAGRATVAIARGDVEAALADLLELGDQIANQFLIANPALLPWRSLAATTAASVGDRERARDLAAEELELARRYGAARPIGIALRAAGLVEGGESGLELLQESVRTLERSPATLELCRSRLELGAALRRLNRRREGREELRRALDFAHRLGLRALERRAREELEASGARLGRPELSGPESLTPSERRVAELAAAGHTNRAIAQQLFVSLRTVETHLTHVYQKLDVSSRSQLANAMRLDSGAIGAG